MDKTDKPRLRSSSPLQLQVYLKNIEPHCFVDKKDAEALKESVQKESHRLDLRNSTGLTVLETAAKADFLEGVKTLLSCGANAAIINQSTGENAFHIAAQHASRTTLVTLMVHAKFPSLTEKMLTIKERLRSTHQHLKTAQEHLALAREQLAMLESPLVAENSAKEEPVIDCDAKISQLQGVQALLLAKHHISELGKILTIKDNAGRTPAVCAQTNTQLTPDLFETTQIAALYSPAIISHYLALLQSE